MHLPSYLKTMDDRSRMRIEYEDRALRLSGLDLYSWSNSAQLFAIQQRQRAVLYSLQRLGFTELANMRILEMGCGGGGVLAEFVCYGASPYNLYGLDLLPSRLKDAKCRLPGTHFVQADGSCIPFPDQSFDLVLQYTAISSVLDPDLRRMICTDMLRVLKPNGLILSYDFWLNPVNKQTRGLTISEIRRSFPGCRVDFQRITLAPPVTRRLAAASWSLCLLLESCKIFNTHYLAVIRPSDTAHQ
jgi:ubiquinone/menaquinone biosynthesis C-methylase UbiE